MGRKVFISYAREDQDFARRLAKDLRARGVDVWLDQIDIKGGEIWDQAVEAALSSSLAVIAILTPESVRSRMVLDEVLYALDENKLVAPVLWRTCTIPFRLRRLHYVDFTDDYASALDELSKALTPYASSRAGGIDSAPVAIALPAASGNEEVPLGAGPADPLWMRLSALIIDHLGVERDELAPTAKFVEDLGADSLDAVELVMAAEQEFGVEISDDQMDRIVTVGDAIAFIAAHKL